MNSKTGFGKVVFSLIYVGIVFTMIYLNEEAVTFGGFGFAYKYILGLLLIALAFLAFLIKPNLQRAAALTRQVYIFSLPYLLTVVYSLFIWAVKFSEFRNITRGFFFVFYQLIAFCAAAASLYMFGRNCFWLYWSAMIAVNIVRILQVIKMDGIAAFISDFVLLLKSAGSQAGWTIGKLELHDPNFAIGLLVVFFVIYRKELKRKWLPLMLTLLLFITGMKRIAVLGIVLACFVCILAEKFGEDTRKVILYCIVGGLFAIGILYPVMIRSGLFEKIMDALQIKTLGRTTMYNYIQQYYDISLSYLGNGLGYVSKLMAKYAEEITIILGTKGYTPGELHNDLLRMLIDIGLPAYLVWLYLFTVDRLRMLLKKEGMKTGVVFVSCLVYLFLTYMTDNTYYYYHTNFVFALLVLWNCVNTEAAESNCGGLSYENK